MRLTAMPRSFPRSPHLLLALVVVVWAGAFAAIKQLLHDGLAAPDIALGRYLIAAPGFAAALVMTRGLPGASRRDLLRLVAAGLLVVVVYHLSLNAGERLTTAGTASVVVAVGAGHDARDGARDRPGAVLAPARGGPRASRSQA